MRLITILFLIFFTAHDAVSALLEDVIYLKNGSSLRGNILQYDPQKQHYQIQLNSGITRIVYEQNIKRIRREAAKIQPFPENVFPIAEPTKTYNHSLSVGNLWHSTYNKHTSTTKPYVKNKIDRYRGLKLNYKTFFNKNFAASYSLEYAKLKEFDYENKNGQSIFSEASTEENIYAGLSATAIVGLAFKRGFLLYAGAGLYNHHYMNENAKDQNYVGTRWELGGGIMFERSFLNFQYQWHGTEMYPDDTTSIFSGGIEWGVAF